MRRHVELTTFGCWGGKRSDLVFVGDIFAQSVLRPKLLLQTKKEFKKVRWCGTMKKYQLVFLQSEADLHLKQFREIRESFLEGISITQKIHLETMSDPLRILSIAEDAQAKIHCPRFRGYFSASTLWQCTPLLKRK